MQSPILLDKLQAAKQRFLDPQDQFKIDGWIKDAQNFLIVDSLKDHNGIKLILENFKNDIDQMNDLLLNADSKALSDADRNRIIDKRNLYRRFIQFFTDAETGIAAIETSVDENLPKETQ